MKTTAYTLLLVVLLSSCETFFDSPIEYFVESPPKKLVVNSLMSPGLPAQVEISTSVPVFESNDYPEFLPNAKAAMYKNGVFWDSLQYQLIPNWPGDYAYFSAQPVEPNNNYSIVVNHPGYTEVQAVSAIPQATAPINFSWLSYPQQKAKFVLPALEEGRYYYIRFFDTFQQLYFRSNSPILEYEEDAFGALEGEQGFYWAYVRPELMNGQDQEVVIEYLNFQVQQNDVIMELFILEEDLYKQNRGLLNYQPDNPFSEPTQIHTNVTNGYGVFSGYAYTQTPIQ